VPVLSLSIGSNVNASLNVRRAVDALRAHFGELNISTVYESEAVGFDGDNFLNLVVTAETGEQLGTISSFLKELEDEMGRDRSQPRFSGRVIDVDIITYGDLDGELDGLELPRDEVTRNAYVLRPLAELLPNQLHGPSGKTYAELWEEYDQSQQSLWPVELNWTAAQD